jgi:hypothetical protein
MHRMLTPRNEQGVDRTLILQFLDKKATQERHLSRLTLFGPALAASKDKRQAIPLPSCTHSGISFAAAPVSYCLIGPMLDRVLLTIFDCRFHAGIRREA